MNWHLRLAGLQQRKRRRVEGESALDPSKLNGEETRGELTWRIEEEEFGLREW